MPSTMNDSDTSDVRVLDPQKLRLCRAAGVTLLSVDGEGSWSGVSVARAFPISDPDHYIGFLDSEGKDIGIVKDPSLLDADSRQVLLEDLEVRYFVPVVEQVVQVKEEFGSVYWTVETNRGRKEFVARNLKDSLLELPGNRVILTDIDGNRYEIPDIMKLNRKAQDILVRSL